MNQSCAVDDAQDALLKGLEEAVAHVVEAFVANPDEPVNVACPGMRQVRRRPHSFTY